MRRTPGAQAQEVCLNAKSATDTMMSGHHTSSQIQKRNLLTSVDGDVALDSLRGREGPAGTASTLVLRGSDHVLGAPVQRGRQLGSGNVTTKVGGFHVLDVDTLVLVALHVRLELFAGHGSKFVDAHHVSGSASRVVSLDLLEVVFQDSPAIVELFLGVVEIELSHELLKGVVVVCSSKILVGGTAESDRRHGGADEELELHFVALFVLKESLMTNE